MENIWPEIIIAAVAAILTWFFNRLTIIAEIKKAKKDKINENRIPLYTECYEILERNILNSNVVFQKDYIDSLIRIKAQMKLIASNNVLQVFRTYYNWVIDIYKDYLKYCEENDPTGNFHTEIAPDGTEFEVPDFNEHDMDHFDLLVEKYIQNRGVKNTTVKSKTQEVLNAMRADLGNDKFDDNYLG